MFIRFSFHKIFLYNLPEDRYLKSKRGSLFIIQYTGTSEQRTWTASPKHYATITKEKKTVWNKFKTSTGKEKKISVYYNCYRNSDIGLSLKFK